VNQWTQLTLTRRDPTIDSGAAHHLGCLHGIETRAILKEMMPLQSSTSSAMMRSAGRVVDASPALSANTCMTPIQRFPVICSISGLSGGSLSPIVTTQVTSHGTQGTPGDGFPSSLRMLTRRGKQPTPSGGLGVKWSQVQILSARQLNTQVRPSF